MNNPWNLFFSEISTSEMERNLKKKLLKFIAGNFFHFFLFFLARFKTNFVLVYRISPNNLVDIADEYWRGLTPTYITNTLTSG